MRLLLFYLLTLSALSGCSTFETRDVFQSNDPVRYEASGIIIDVWFKPDTRFSSIGPLGIPVVPIVMTASKQDEFALVVSLQQQKNLDFSFITNLCLNVDTQPLCPRQMEIHAIAMAKDDGTAHADKIPRWHKLPEFQSAREMVIDSVRPIRISKKDILTHYNHTGTHWDYLRIDAIYKYKCDSGCPENLVFDTRQLVTLDGKSPFGKVHSFRRLSVKEYDALAPLQ